MNFVIIHISLLNNFCTKLYSIHIEYTYGIFWMVSLLYTPNKIFAFPVLILTISMLTLLNSITTYVTAEIFLLHKKLWVFPQHQLFHTYLQVVPNYISQYIFYYLLHQFLELYVTKFVNMSQVTSKILSG